MDKDGEPSLVAAKRTGVYLFPRDSVRFGWSQFMSQMDLVKDYVRDGQITFVCSIMVLHDSGIPVPPSDIGKNLGMLLDSMDGLDVSFFTVDGETFHAHRAVLAARSPVFRAELLGSMAEVTMSSITLLDIAPATFRIVLRFMYMDAFPVQDELGDSHSEVLQHLLAAADPAYAQLQLAQFPYDVEAIQSADATVVAELTKLSDTKRRYLRDPAAAARGAAAVGHTTLAAHAEEQRRRGEEREGEEEGGQITCAEMYSCLELKKKCIGFIVAEKIFNKVVLTEGFMQLRQNFPFIITEVRSRFGT
ncbi:hypothetical protein SETIT_6G215500v2 [Setaria italica]|uniref:BTB domain-containing protein n=1 Tax=Setaria italica TaxID=4555 RepID=A0A368RNW2_SETIT|nr:hypothetical protein SETIT_6G215500v2 [Setaria italica]